MTGTVIEQLQAQGRFAGPRLVLSGISGSTPGGGTIAGSGTVDFSGGKAALDLKFDASRARLLDRDDIAATVTGPLAIRSSGEGGTISGKLQAQQRAIYAGQGERGGVGPAAEGPQRRAGRRRGDRGRSSCSRGSSTSILPAAT